MTMPEMSEKDRGFASSSSARDTTPTSHNKEDIEIIQLARPAKAHLRPLRTTPSAVCPFSPSQLTLDECCMPYAPVNSASTKKMGLSKSTRIIILLVIDSAFFITELVIGRFTVLLSSAEWVLTQVPGYAVHSLALVADSFHMVRFQTILFNGENSDLN